MTITAGGAGTDATGQFVFRIDNKLVCAIMSDEKDICPDCGCMCPCECEDCDCCASGP